MGIPLGSGGSREADDQGDSFFRIHNIIHTAQKKKENPRGITEMTGRSILILVDNSIQKPPCGGIGSGIPLPQARRRNLGRNQRRHLVSLDCHDLDFGTPVFVTCVAHHLHTWPSQHPAISPPRRPRFDSPMSAPIPRLHVCSDPHLAKSHCILFCAAEGRRL